MGVSQGLQATFYKGYWGGGFSHYSPHNKREMVKGEGGASHGLGGLALSNLMDFPSKKKKKKVEIYP
jgi:hypothetical protein